MDCYEGLNLGVGVEKEFMDDGTDKSEQLPLIGGLPDDVSVFCLARVPRQYHTVLKCVSRRWRDLVCSEEWRTYRRKHHLSETWLYALCRDRSEQMCCYVLDPNSSRRRWKLIPDFPSRCLKRKGIGFEALGNHIYLLGGCGWLEDATDQAYYFDVSRNSWGEATPLSTARCYFACEVFDGKIYAIGGLVSNTSDPHSWDTFDPQTNTWESHSGANVIADIEDSIVFDGKMYIRFGASSVPSQAYAIHYEPSSGAWQCADADMVSGWQGPAVVVDGTLYVLDQSSGTRLMMWQKDQRDWAAVGRLSPLLTKPPCQMVAVQNRIFIVGKGLSTVAFDIDKTGNIERVMVSTSITKLNNDEEVICCKGLAL